MRAILSVLQEVVQFAYLKYPSYREKAFRNPPLHILRRFVEQGEERTDIEEIQSHRHYVRILLHVYYKVIWNESDGLLRRKFSKKERDILKEEIYLLVQ